MEYLDHWQRENNITKKCCLENKDTVWFHHKTEPSRLRFR